jgi:hypothetical protein
MQVFPEIGAVMQAQQETEAAIQDGNLKYSDMLAQG